MDRTLRIVLARRVKQFMEANPALDTQTALGAASGVAQSTIGRILRGDVAVTLDVVESIAAAFSVSAMDLLTDYERAQPDSRVIDMLMRAATRMQPADIQKVLDYARFVAAQSVPPHQLRRTSTGELNGTHEGAMPNKEAAGSWRKARSEIQQTDKIKTELDATHVEPARQRRPRKRPD